ncbi:helix-turn-helix domain-containing protein [Halomonas huangheensis]|uniref:HTH cro/C1-type domain-containing protein n=1 Tax=Halomonas huangheensis TaxID=1178482 RepID=W1N849_9GAMM|nr:XRE family transcriptional regulator [Halomonas huangheensis]ALM53087.1 XRE family transcriptional regulator [Halomonas huangheensis]ERL51346.1 hypothetical protein BJB45_14235 [Halomonas huangheensis]
MDKISLSTLGQHLQQLRTTRGWSLSQLASMAGIAKSNLSRLEQGNGNPTLDTLWRLAVHLEVPFGTLVAPISAPLDEDGVQVQLLDQGRDKPPVDVYWMRCAPWTERQAEAHTPGARENITVISGQLAVGPINAIQTVSAGETISFDADQMHSYRTEESWATLMMTIVYLRGEAPHT